MVESETISTITIDPYSTYYNPYGKSSWTSTYSWNNILYMYELNCPRCKTRNWGQIDEIIVCKNKNCSAKLKAVAQEVDFEIPVG